MPLPRIVPMKIGTFALLNAPSVCEMAGLAGFDFVVIDCEHSSSTPPAGNELLHMLRAAETGGAEPWVRVRSNDPVAIGVAVENGARGVIVPHVRSRQDAERAVAAVVLQPDGTRGNSPFGREFKYGFGPRRNVHVAALIEDPDGVARVGEIAATPGLSSLFFGHYDLAVAMRNPRPMIPDATIERMRDDVHAAAKRAGIAAAAFAWDAMSALSFAQRGAEFIAISTDLTLLAGAFKAIRAELSGSTNGRPEGSTHVTQP